MALFYSLTVFVFLSSVLASPIQRRAISTQLFNTFSLYEQYAAAAYCPADNDAPPNSKIVCTADVCPLVQAANTSSVIEFSNTSATDTTGYLAVDTTNRLIVLSYRGSESIKNYLSDLNFALTGIDLCTDCQGDSGFWSSWVESRTLVLPAMNATVAAYPGFKVVVTGHSLGAAVGTFAAAELRKSGIAADLCTFGSPRVGDPTTASYITAQADNGLGANYRLAHTNDPVPRLPPEAFNYKHVEPEYYISSGNNVPVTTNDIEICDCNENATSLDLSAHDWYFNDISGCYPGNS